MEKKVSIISRMIIIVNSLLEIALILMLITEVMQKENIVEMIVLAATVLIIPFVTGLFFHEYRLYLVEYEKAKDQAHEIEAMNKAQSKFFSSMSHEIRTPINTIIGLNEMILRENAGEEVAENARNIQAASKILLSLINDILDMSKIESGKWT